MIYSSFLSGFPGLDVSFYGFYFNYHVRVVFFVLGFGVMPFDVS